jgi:Protein of unknown function (DUF3175)
MGGKKAGKRRWSGEVKTVSTYPPAGLFTRDAETIARVMASKKVSPKGIGSGIRMIQFFINRAGQGLPPERRKELEKARTILQARAREIGERQRSG